MARETEKQITYAQRLSRPGIRDPRLLVGILLVAVSVLAVIGVVRMGNSKETFYIANHDIVVGQKISRDDLSSIEVNLGEAKNHYLKVDSNSFPDKVVAINHVKEGELIAINNLAESDPQGRRKVTVIQDTVLTQNLRAGDKIDVWVSAKTENGNGYHDPSLVAQRAEIAVIAAEESIIGGTGKSSVTLLIDENSLITLLAAVNNDDRINLIPAQLEEDK